MESNDSWGRNYTSHASGYDLSVLPESAQGLRKSNDSAEMMQMMQPSMVSGNRKYPFIGKPQTRIVLAQANQD